MTSSKPSAAATRERLLDEALTLFSQRGYAATSVRDILQAAQVTQPTLYYHFADKCALFRELIERHYGESQRQLAAIIDSTNGCRHRLRTIAVNSFEYCCRDPRVPRLMFQTYFGPTLPEIDGILDELTEQRFGLVTRIMRDGIAQSELRKSDPELLALCYCCLIDQPINLFSRKAKPKRYLTIELAEAILDIFFRGAA